MEKLLTLLNILLISGTTIPIVISASIHEKQEIKDEVINFQHEDNLRNLSRYKRQGEFDEIPDVSAVLKGILNDLAWRHLKAAGWRIRHEDITIQLFIKIKSIYETIPRGTIEGQPEIVAKDCTTVTNSDNTTQDVASTEVLLKTTVINTSTISNTFDFTGDFKITSVPIIGSEGKFLFKFSRTSTTTSTISNEVSKKVPSQKIRVEPHTRKRVVSELYASPIVTSSYLTIEVDEDSLYTWKIPRDSAHKRYLTPDLEEHREHSHLGYPAAIYCGTVRCVEFKDNKIYLRYYPLETKIVKTELSVHIEQLTPEMNERC